MTWYRQQYTLDCEAAALQIALSHQGLHPSQDALLASMRPDGLSAIFDASGRLRWGDPYRNFVGDPRGHEYDGTGYGAYWPVIEAAARAAGGSVIGGGEGVDAQSVYRWLWAGHPVIVRVSFDWRQHPRQDYLATDGRTIPFMGPYDHVVVLVGVRVGAVLVADPDGGGARADHPYPAEYWVADVWFESTNSLLDRQAVGFE